MGRSSLRVRLLLLVAVTILPGLLAPVIMARILRAQMMGQARTEAEQVARLAAEQQQRLLDTTAGVLTALATHPAILDRDAAACGPAVRRVAREHGFWVNVHATAPDGAVFCSAAPLTRPVSLADRAHFRDARDRRRLSGGEYVLSRTTGLHAVAFSVPVIGEDGELRAVLSASVDVAEMQRRLESMPVPPGTVVSVTDRNGVVLARRPGPEGRVGQPTGEDEEPPGDGGPARGARLSASEQVYGVGSDPVFTVVASLPAEVLYAPVNRLYHLVLVVLGVTALLSLALAVVTGEFLLVRRLRAVVSAARRISAGDGSARTGVPRSGDEIGELAGAFDEMAASLEALTRQNRMLLDAVGEGIVGLDRAGAVTFANPAAARLLGRTVDAMRGARLVDLVRHGTGPGPAAAAGAEDPLVATLRDGLVHAVTDDTFWRGDGTRFPADAMATPVVDRGDLVGAVVAFRDVGERQTLEEQLRQAQKMEAIGQLAGGIAHDFNNLLTAIISCARFAEEDLPADHPVRADLEEILGAAGRAATLTKHLLAFSRRQVPDPRVLDLVSVVREVERVLRRLIGEHVALEVHAGGDVGRVRADPGFVEQILLNLAVNARDAMPEGGRIRLRVTDVDPADPEAIRDAPLPEGPLVCLSMEDTGVGMDAQTLSRAYEPFFTTKPVGQGTGLGLSIVYGLVTQSGGAIRASSEPGRGSVFRIYLPRVEAPAGEAPGLAAGAAPRGHETVLVLEDDDVVRSLVRRTLARVGYRVVEAGRPSEALAWLGDAALEVHLLLTDVLLPEMSGAQVAVRAAALRPRLRVLFVSGYAGAAFGEAGAAPGARELLAKPFTPDQLLRKVREVLDRPAVPGAAGVRDPERTAG